MNSYEIKIEHYNCKNEEINILSDDNINRIKETIRHIINTELQG